QAYLLLGQALRREPDNQEWRRRSVELAVALGRYSDAKSDLENSLLKSAPNDAELLAQLGVCRAALDDYSGAVQAFESAIKSSPDTIDNYALLAELLRSRLMDVPKAEKTLDRMVENNRDDYRVYLVRGQWYLTSARSSDETGVRSLKAGDKSEAIARARMDAERAVELKPQASETALFAADVAINEG